MIKKIKIGKVVEISGVNIQIETIDFYNDLTLIHNFEVYDGVTVGQYIGIIRGPYLLACRIEREYLIDSLKDPMNEKSSIGRIRRRLEVKLLGYFENGEFQIGVMAYPMVYNDVVLLSSKQKNSIIGGHIKKEDPFVLNIGNTINENIPFLINATNIFNTHIGVFGNTGSGKSNTLAKLYTELFDLNGNNNRLKKSEFLIFDYNGEYVGSGVFKNKKNVLELSTRVNNKDKITISCNQFWNAEVLSIIFSATEKTQKPFLKNVLNYFVESVDKGITSEKLIEGISAAFYNTFHSNNTPETNNYLHLIYDVLKIKSKQELPIPYYDVKWNSTTNNYYLDLKNECNNFYQKSYEINNSCIYFNSKTQREIIEARTFLEESLRKNYINGINNLSSTDKLKIAIYSHVIYILSYGTINFEFISPLISRLDARSKIINNVIEIGEPPINKDLKLTIISFKDCNVEAKKLLSLLLVKDSYDKHKKLNQEGLNNSFHLIIDEAHNILSEQSNREESTWKDYRLDVFEEIIKEGRKFGYYITMSSQRPADISPTLISQLHNYFIHRLVSEKDLKLIDNTINTLDSVSKSSIPTLSPGQCIVTGTSFDLPIAVKISKLESKYSPNSESANLEELWKCDN